jgi:ATP-dependent helicase/nuclease subunit A
MNLVHPLYDNQAKAVDPDRSVWLSASAGTGKTQVLSARVLRLLLQPDVTPSQILCLTFTKAGAAEMAVRVNEVLASWVRMKPEALARDLMAIGADFSPEAQERARTLFASVLDCPGGGLRIDTIHAFAQWLLSAFPEEAGLTPGTKAMEDRDRELLAREVLAGMLLAAQDAGDGTVLDAIEALSLQLGPDGVHAWLMRCAGAHELWFGPGAWTPPLAGRVNRLLGLPVDAGEADLAGLCTDDAFPVSALRVCLSAYSQWNGKKGQAGRVVLAEWLAAGPEMRAAMLPELHSVLFTQKDTVRDAESLAKFEPSYAEAAENVLAASLASRELRAQLDLAARLTPALTLGRKFAVAWDEAKQREGLIDFDDQIRRAANLLGRNELADWIRYKLDRQFDHILIDEAQDTNQAQWDIINALTGDFFSGEGARDGKMRTLFVVGDYKQAIFRFQGTSPENFEDARKRVKREMNAAAGNVVQLRANHQASRLRELGLEKSFRTGQPVLDFVDAALGTIGHSSFGLPRPAEPHIGKDRPGLVTLWPALGGAADAGSDDEESSDDQWLSRPERQMAERIARQVRAWLDDGFLLVKDTPRRAGPGDIMVLVRKRRELAGLIVARLYAAGVPVAGVDRLRLGAPLAVKDLVAALRFAAQPFDDLSLANLLVSPLIGWSQQQLLDHGWRPDKVPLWSHLRASLDPEVMRTRDMLGDLLALADFEPPQALLHWLLVGPWQGRRKLVSRLGREANDPIDELLNAAHGYAASHTPSLQGFLQWFDAGEGELKREAGSAGGLVRVMTVHGSKGLQAPIVILADAAGNPEKSRPSDLVLEEDVDPAIAHRHSVPILPLSKDERAGRVAQAHADAQAAEMQEHWRLLYVAMTRAEEALFIGGSLGASEKEPATQSWYGQLSPLFPQDEVADPIWGWRKEWGTPATGSIPAREAAALPHRSEVEPWALLPAGPEARPPRPLAPSSAGSDQSADPPFAAEAMAQAARRGTLIHALLERLPLVARDQRSDAAARWLARRAADLADADRDEISGAVMRVLDDPRWAEIFSPAALAEVPLAAVVEGQVVAGTVDRLLVTKERVLVADFKTARRPPNALEQVPISTLRQMAAYAAALERIYPDRSVEVAVLYTQTPEIFAIPPDLLEAHKPSFTSSE